MKIALILTGLMRCYKDGWQSWHIHFPHLIGDCDIFISTWDELGFYTGRGYLPARDDGFIRLEENEKGFHSGDKINVSDIIETYKPIAFCVEQFEKFEPTFQERSKHFNNAFTRPKNTISQFYKVRSGINLMRQYSETTGTKYDLVIRTRPDYVLQSALSQQLDVNTFYANEGTNHTGAGIGDQIHIASYDLMLRFADIYNRLEMLYDEIGYSCPHVFAQRMVTNHMQVPLGRVTAISKIQHGPHGPYNEPDGSGRYAPA